VYAITSVFVLCINIDLLLIVDTSVVEYILLVSLINQLDLCMPKQLLANMLSDGWWPIGDATSFEFKCTVEAEDFFFEQGLSESGLQLGRRCVNWDYEFSYSVPDRFICWFTFDSESKLRIFELWPGLQGASVRIPLHTPGLTREITQLGTRQHAVYLRMSDFETAE